jgi:hypothetical protein
MDIREEWEYPIIIPQSHERSTLSACGRAEPTRPFLFPPASKENPGASIVADSKTLLSAEILAK